MARRTSPPHGVDQNGVREASGRIASPPVCRQAMGRLALRERRTRTWHGC